jgi:hypothetical protein
MLLVDAIATVILAGLMLVPIVNVIAGGVVGAGLAGPLGGVIGILLAIGVTALETWLADRLGLRNLHLEPAQTMELVAEEVAAPAERTIKTGPPLRRRQAYRGRASAAIRHAAPVKTFEHGVAR